MPATRRLGLDLPETVADAIEAHVVSGDYPHASHVAAAGVDALPAVAALDLDPVDEDSPECKAIVAECDEGERRIDEGLESTSSLDAVFDRLEARAKQRTARRAAP